MMQFASLGSGSRGNALLIESQSTKILVDCGFSQSQIEKRLNLLGRSSKNLDAIIITHEHSDHIGCGMALSSRIGIPIFMTHGTRSAIKQTKSNFFQPIEAETLFSFRDFEILPFTVPHDAREPVQFIFSDGQYRIGLLTDLGHCSKHVLNQLTDLDTLLLEFNHDVHLLKIGPYADSLKERIGGPYGHLSNSASTHLLKSINQNKLQHVIGMHLSESNNTPSLARQALAQGLSCTIEETSVANQEHGFSWRNLS